jgi:hypothetical protein
MSEMGGACRRGGYKLALEGHWLWMTPSNVIQTIIRCLPKLAVAPSTWAAEDALRTGQESWQERRARNQCGPSRSSPWALAAGVLGIRWTVHSRFAVAYRSQLSAVKNKLTSIGALVLKLGRAKKNPVGFGT